MIILNVRGFIYILNEPGSVKTGLLDIDYDVTK